MQESIYIPSSGGHKLAGVVHRPDAGRPVTWALFAHCFTCTKNIRAAVEIADALCAEGIAVLRFDFTGLGQSEGEFAETHFSANVQDIMDVAKHMAESGRAPEILVGHSLGGTAVLAAAHEIDSSAAVATIGSPAEAEHVLHLLEDDLETIELRGSARVKLAGRPFEIRRDFVEDIRAQSVRDGVRTLRKALLVMHSPVDELVSVDEAARIYKSARHPKSFISLDDADHLLSRRSDAQYAGKVLASWASRFVKVRKRPALAARFRTGEVVAAGSAEDGFLLSLNVDGHPMLADEPEDVGGDDLGPTPYDLLSAALASCTVMTLHLYARRKDWPLEFVRAEIRHNKIHARDCENCETREGKIDRFDKRLHLTGDLDDVQRKRLLEIADMCPVHRTLKEEVQIRAELID